MSRVTLFSPSQVDDALDKQLAAHILSVHRLGSAPALPEGQLPHIPPNLLRAYIAQAKTYEPSVPEQLTGTWFIQHNYARRRRRSHACLRGHMEDVGEVQNP